MTAKEAARLSPVARTSWCQDGTGHPEAWHPLDQYCISEEVRVPLLRHNLIDSHDGLQRD